MYDINNTKLVSQFSGLYKLTTITSSFKNGKFTQNLVANRRQGQDNTAPPNAKSFPTAKTVVTNTSDGSTTEMTPAQVRAARDRGEIEE
jgi:hypothetical protein